MKLRAPRLEDAHAVAALYEATGPEPVSESLFRRAWTAPGVDVERDVRLAEEGGQIVGYAEIVADAQQTKFWLWVRGKPSADLVRFGERRARETAASGGRIVAEAWSDDEATKEALEQAGFRLVRHTYRMGVDLDRNLDEPAWPEGIRVRTFQPGDERAVYEAHQETFEDLWDHVRTPYDDWAHWFLSAEAHHPDLWFLAFDGDRLAGVELCAPDEGQPGTAWVHILGVRRAWRGRGLGRALLLHAFDEFRRRGFDRVLLGVDAASPTGAHQLYERVGMRVLHRIDTYERLLP